MNENIFKVEIPVNVRFNFNRQKFAEYMCADIDKNSEEYDEAYEVFYNYPNECGFTKEDVKYMLENNILIRLDEDEIDAEHIDEYLYEE